MRMHDIRHQRRADQFVGAAHKLQALAVAVDDVAAILDESADTCPGCGTARYRNFPQKQLRDRVAGAATRLREAADVFARRAHDDGFNQPAPADMLCTALDAVLRDAVADDGTVRLSQETLALVRAAVDLSPPHAPSAGRK